MLCELKLDALSFPSFLLLHQKSLLKIHDKQCQYKTVKDMYKLAWDSSSMDTFMKYN